MPDEIKEPTEFECTIFEQLKESKDIGNQHFSNRSFRKAILAYEVGLAIQSVSGFSLEEIALREKLLSNKAMCHMELNEYKKCIESCTDALETNPNLKKALWRRAYGFEKICELSNAIRDHRLLLKIDPKNKVVIQMSKRLARATWKEKEESAAEKQLINELKKLSTVELHRRCKSAIGLDMSSNSGNPKELEIILEHCAIDVNSLIWMDRPLFYWAATLSSPEVLETLIKFGADVNCEGYKGYIPVFVACQQLGKQKNLQLLVKNKNVNLYFRNFEGYGLLDVAPNRHKFDIVLEAMRERESEALLQASKGKLPDAVISKIVDHNEIEYYPDLPMDRMLLNSKGYSPFDLSMRKRVRGRDG
eukprot:322482_1